jgi:hypothetical protein
MNVSGAAAHAGFREELRAGARHVAAQVAPAEQDVTVAAAVVPPAAAVELNASVEEPDVRAAVGVAAAIPGAAAQPDVPVGVWAELPVAVEVPDASVEEPDEQAAVRAGSLVLAA